MSNTITALFDQRSDAEAAAQKLKAASIDANHIQLHDKASSGFSEDAYSTQKDPGIWGKIKNAFMPDEDRHTYEEGLRRGGTLLTVDVEEDQTDDVLRVLEESNGVDVNDRSEQWRSSGWENGSSAVGVGASPATGSGASPVVGSAATTRTDVQAGAANEEVIPIVEEELLVGKRQVDRGGARVRSYVSEVPVHEQIRLRDERVQVSRRQVNQPLSGAEGDAFRERTVEMTATGEEAVISKQAHVVEEVVISKAAEERVQEVNDTVRRTEVEIDNESNVDKGVQTHTDRQIRQ